MAEIIQYHHKDDDIQFEIIVRSKSVHCHSAITDMSEIDKKMIKYALSDLAKDVIAQYIHYEPK